jgi:hypothetical protein
MCDFETLENQNVPLQRISLDIANPNEFEHKLLNFCNGNSLFSANSRCAKDRGIGAVTSNNTAVVDYLLLSPTLFSSIKEFEIAYFNPLFSDIHCGIHVTFHGRVTTMHFLKKISPIVLTTLLILSPYLGESLALLTSNN